MQFFPHVARLTDGEYTVEKFTETLAPLFSGISATRVTKATSIKIITDHFVECLNRGFTL